MEEIKKTLKNIFNLSEEESTVFLSVFTKIVLPKNAVFIETGKVCH